MTTDKNGAPLYVGDEVVLRAKVIDVTADHVLTTTTEKPNRELWFQSATVERTVQGPASLDAEKNPAPAPAVAAVLGAPTTAAAPSPSLEAAMEKARKKL
jgi:hypothetical protein